MAEKGEGNPTHYNISCSFFTTTLLNKCPTLLNKATRPNPSQLSLFSTVHSFSMAIKSFYSLTTVFFLFNEKKSMCKSLNDCLIYMPNSTNVLNAVNAANYVLPIFHMKRTCSGNEAFDILSFWGVFFICVHISKCLLSVKFLIRLFYFKILAVGCGEKIFFLML